MSKNAANDGNVSVASGAFSAKIDAQSVSTLVGNMNATRLITPDFKNRTNSFSVPEKDISEYTVYDLNGRRVNGKLVDRSNLSGSAPRCGARIHRAIIKKQAVVLQRDFGISPVTYRRGFCGEGGDVLLMSRFGGSSASTIKCALRCPGLYIVTKIDKKYGRALHSIQWAVYNI